jgi:type IV secretion system protein VirB3
MPTEHEALDPVFKGCTRPAMFMGVPVTPLVLTFIAMFTIAALARNMFLLLLFVPIVVVMRLIVRNDDQKFRLLYLNARFRLSARNAKFWGAHAFNPIAFKKRNNQ